MTQKTLNIYQFKVSLLEVKPLIWRRIQVVETYTFWDLHVAIQDAMGWEDYHLHEFRIRNPQSGKDVLIGIPDLDGISERVTLEGWHQNIRDFFSLENPQAKYEYDFGDGWEHKIVLESILSSEESKSKFPKCVSGARSCPPEDCGGPWGYAHLLEIIKNPKDPQYKEKIKWLGKLFNAESFDPELIRFDNPKKRWKIAFEDSVTF